MRRSGASLVALCALATTASADPKPTADQEQQAAALFAEGRKLLTDDHDSAAACDKFNQAIRLNPDAAGTMLNLGLCNENLGKLKTALYWFRKAQAQATETNLPDAERAAREHTTDLAAKVATVRIAFSSPPPPDTKIKIDDEDIRPDDYQRAEVDPGRHTLVAGAPGHKIVNLPFDVPTTPANTQTLTVELVAGDNTVIIDRGSGRRRLAVITAVGGGVLMAASGLLAWHERSVYCDAFPAGQCGDETAAGIDYAQVHRAYKAARWYATSMFIGGVAAVGVGIALYVTAPRAERIDRTVWVPTLGPDQIGFAVSGGF